MLTVEDALRHVPGGPECPRPAADCAACDLAENVRQMAAALVPSGEPLLRVMAEKCSSCIFGPNSPLRRGRFEDLRAHWEKQGAEAHQVCHLTGAWDEDDEDEERPDPSTLAVCRGFYQEMYIERGLPVAALQIAERLGLLDLDYRP